MTARLKRNLGILNQIYKAKPKLQKSILAATETDTVASICEACHNILKGSVPLSPGHKRQLARHKKHIRQLAQKRGSLKAKRQLLVQRGGLASAILAPLLTVAATLLTQWLNK